MARVKKVRGGKKELDLTNLTNLADLIGIDVIDKNFQLYRNKTESDYWVIVNGERIPTQSTIITYDDIRLIKKVKDENGKEIELYEKEFVERLSPDNIDCCKFWKKATDNFPLFSVAGGIQTITTIEELNCLSIYSASSFGVLKILDYYYQKNKDLKLLEIGPGHGGLYKLIAKNFGDENYYAIDVNPLFEYPRLFKTDGKTIPDTIPCELDCVYSVNVFQHLSKSQRTAYYRQIYTALKKGGIFIFGMFVITDENKDWPVWSTRDVDGKIYCNFFKQLTEVDTEDVLLNELTDLGFNVIPIPDARSKSHYLVYVCETT